jgi:hypothetical protein
MASCRKAGGRLNKGNCVRGRTIAPIVAGCLPILVAAAAALAAEPVRFSIVGDTRGLPGCVDVLRKLKVAGGPGAFLLTPGDTDPADTTRAQLDRVFGPDLAWYPQVGNHETHSKSSMAYLRDYFDKRLKGKVNRGPAGTEQTTYSFDAGALHIVVVNDYWTGANAPGSDAGKEELTPALCQWLQADLAASRKPWKLVMGHEPAFPRPDANWGTARHVDDSLDRNPRSRDDFWKVLEGEGVAAYICGHTHRYSRYLPPGSRVWQIDAAQARGNQDWKYDTFVMATGDDSTLTFRVYRNLKIKGEFTSTDSLKLALPTGVRATSH